MKFQGRSRKKTLGKSASQQIIKRVQRQRGQEYKEWKTILAERKELVSVNSDGEGKKETNAWTSVK